MNRRSAFDLVSAIMGDERRRRSTVRQINRDVSEEDSLSSSTTNSGAEDEEDAPDFRTFYDFESDDSLPHIAVKTFLLDCFQVPKILCHKDFQFFRNYLAEVGVDFKMPSDAPFSENHEDTHFCLDRSDPWLNQLKERINSNQINEGYWASIIPVQRRSDLGLVIFRWEVTKITLHFLHVYLKFCERTSEGESDEYVDGYIKDFKRRFDIERNMDVEARFKDDAEATLRRKLENKVEPVMTRELAMLLKTPPKGSFPSASGSSTKPKTDTYKKDTSSSDNSDSTDSESSTSSDDSNISEYQEKYTKKRPRKKIVKKTLIGFKHPTKKTLTGSGTSTNNNKTNVPTASSSKNSKITRKPNGIMQRLNGKINESNNESTNLEIIACKICGDERIFPSRTHLLQHISYRHAPAPKRKIFDDAMNAVVGRARMEDSSNMSCESS